MIKKEIERILKIEKTNEAIKSFRDCYKDNEIYSNMDGYVEAETLIAFLMTNPHFQEIANNINKLK